MRLLATRRHGRTQCGSGLSCALSCDGRRLRQGLLGGRGEVAVTDLAESPARGQADQGEPAARHVPGPVRAPPEPLGHARDLHVAGTPDGPRPVKVAGSPGEQQIQVGREVPVRETPGQERPCAGVPAPFGLDKFPVPAPHRQDAVITADAMQATRENARWIVEDKHARPCPGAGQPAGQVRAARCAGVRGHPGRGTPGSPLAFATRPVLAARAVRHAGRAGRPTTISLRRVPSATLTSWPTSGLASVSGRAAGCGSSDAQITRFPMTAGVTRITGRNASRPGCDLPGDHP